MQRLGKDRCDVRSALRDATGAVHERLHGAEPFVKISRKQLSLNDYSDLLARIAAFHFSVCPSVGLDEARRCLLADDLERLHSPQPATVSLTSPQTLARRLGWEYVIEGSSLGGKVLYRQLDYLFGGSPIGRRFFGGSPSDGPRWRVLCDRLEIEGRSRSARDEIIDAATGAFALFEQFLAPVRA